MEQNEFEKKLLDALSDFIYCIKNSKLTEKENKEAQIMINDSIRMTDDYTINRTIH